MCYDCDHRTAATDFLLAKKEYSNITGNIERKSDVLLYHMRQSFKPGEIDAETAIKIGYDLASRFTKGQHSFVVAVHDDKAHIHCHIMFSAVNLDCTKKFTNFWGSSFALRRLSDIICFENGLSIIENPKPSRGHYGTWMGDNKEPTLRGKLERFIDEILAQKPVDFESFLRMLAENNCEIKYGKHISLRLDGQKRFIRLRSLSDEYSENAICERISGQRKTVNISDAPIPQKVNLLIDIQNSIKAQNSPGYERWAKIFNLKQMAQTLIFLEENNITEMDTLQKSAQQSKDEFNDLQTRIHTIDTRMKDIAILQKHIGAYIKTKDVYAAYKKSGYSKKFLSKHENQINACKSAKDYFDELRLTKLPTIKTLQAEYATLSAEKKKLYGNYHAKREYMQNVLKARQNVQMLLGYDDRESERTNQRFER